MTAAEPKDRQKERPQNFSQRFLTCLRNGRRSRIFGLQQDGTIATIAMTPEAITNAILAALSAGAATGVTDTTKKAIADAYVGLKSIIKAKFGRDSEAAVAIDKLEARPDSEGRRRTLSEELKAVNAVSDPDLASAAQSVLELIRALPEGEKHIQFAQGSGIAQADRGSTASVTMSAPPTKDD
jgi:hypothetical protein